MTQRLPRCIVLDGHHRCHRRAARGLNDLYACARHGRVTVAVMADWLAPATRQMLAFAVWETASEGQRLIGRFHRGESA